MAAATTSKLVLITGATGGIGREVAKQLLQQGHRVVLAGRSEPRAQAVAQKLLAEVPPAGGEDADERVACVRCDLSSFASVRECAADVRRRWQQLDVLLLCAGQMAGGFRRTEDGFESTYQVNHLSHFLLAHLLLPTLARAPAARVVVVSSELHAKVKSIPATPEYLRDVKEGDPFEPNPIYGLSKLFNVWFVQQLAPQLPTSIVVNAVTPGFVPATDLSRDMASSWLLSLAKLAMGWLPFAVSLREGGRRVAAVCVGDAEGRVSGRYYSKGVQAETGADAKDARRQAQLWEQSLKDAGVEGPYVPEGPLATGDAGAVTAT